MYVACNRAYCEIGLLENTLFSYVFILNTAYTAELKELRDMYMDIIKKNTYDL